MSKTAFNFAVIHFSFLIILALIAAPAVGGAEEKITIRLTTVQMPGQQMGAACSRLAEKVAHTLGDRVDLKVYPSAQLYRSKEEIEALARGEIEMSFVIGSKLEVLDPSFQILKLPFLFPDVDTAYAVLDGPVGVELFGSLPGKGLHFLGLVHSGNVVLSNSRRPLLRPEDFQGLRMRSFGRIGKDTLAALGATAVVTASSETFSALQQGVIDGLATPNAVYLKRKYETIQKYVTDGGMLNFTNSVLLANEDFWKGLPEDVRLELERISAELIAEMRVEMAEENEKIFNRIEKSGNEVYRLTPAQMATWKKLLQSVYDRHVADIGIGLFERTVKSIELSEGS